MVLNKLARIFSTTNDYLNRIKLFSFDYLNRFSIPIISTYLLLYILTTGFIWSLCKVLPSLVCHFFNKLWLNISLTGFDGFCNKTYKVSIEYSSFQFLLYRYVHN